MILCLSHVEIFLMRLVFILTRVMDNTFADYPTAFPAVADDVIVSKKKKPSIESPDSGESLMAMLSASETSNAALKWLANLGQDSELAKHVIREYCERAGDFSSIFHYLSSSSESNGLKIKTCVAIEGILLILSGDDCDAQDKEVLSKFATAVCSNEHLRTIVNLMTAKNGAQAALKLLTALAVTNVATANLVVKHFNWDMFKKNIATPASDLAIVRSCVAYLAIALLLHADEQNENVVSAAVTGKGRLLFDTLFTHLATIAEEDPQLALLVIDTLDKKICQNVRIAKTAKMKLFTEQNTEHLLKLFVNNRELTDILQSLLRRLFTDTKFGVIFVDQKFSTSGLSGNSNVLASKIISYLLTQKNGGLLSFLVEILTACPDQIPHYLEELKSHVKVPEILLSNALVVAQLPPVTSVLPKNIVPSFSVLPLLTALFLPQSTAFLDLARSACKSGSKNWETVSPAITFLSSLLHRCAAVFQALPSTFDQVLRVFFWRVKRCFVDPDKVLQLANSAVEWLKSNDAKSNDQGRHVIAGLNSCLTYLTAYSRFSNLLMLSFPLDKLISEVKQLAAAKVTRGLRKPLARFCLTICLAKDWWTDSLNADNSCSDTCLLHWVVEEASVSPKRHALLLGEVFSKLAGVQMSRGYVAAIIFVIGGAGKEETSPAVTTALLVGLFEGMQSLSNKKKKPAFLLKYVRSLAGEDVAITSNMEALSLLLQEQDTGHPHLQNGSYSTVGPTENCGALARLVNKIVDVGYDIGELEKCIDDVFLDSTEIDGIIVRLLMRWMVNLSLLHDANSVRYASIGACLSVLFKRDEQHLANFLRVLIHHPAQLASIDNISHSQARYCLGPAIQAVSRYICNHPNDVTVCIGRQSLDDGTLCKFTGESAVRFMKRLLKHSGSNIDKVATSVAVSLCPQPADLYSLADKIANRALKKPDELEPATALLQVLLSELNFRHETVGNIFIEFCGKLVFPEDGEEVPTAWNESADLLYDIVASRKACARSLRTLLCSASIKSLKHLAEYWRNHDGRTTYHRVMTVFAECVALVCNQSYVHCSPKTRKRLFDLITLLLPIVPQKSHVSALLFLSGVKCLTMAVAGTPSDVSLGHLLSLINHGNVSLCRQSDLLIILNLLSSASSAEQVEQSTAVGAISSVLRSVSLPISQYHQSFTSVLQSMLCWSGINSSTMTAVADICATIDVGSMKPRHKGKLVQWLIESCNNFQGPEKWLVHTYVTPAVVQSIFEVEDLVTDDVRALIDATESVLFDDSGNPHDYLLKTIGHEGVESNVILKCLHALMWFRGPSWRSYNSVWQGVVPVLLANYTATMSQRDQIIFSCLALFDNCFETFEAERPLWAWYQPCVWGPRSNKAGKALAPNGSTFSPAAMRQSADTVLECLSPKTLLDSALALPIDRSLFQVERSIVQNVEPSSLYDPAFLLPVFARTFLMQHCPITPARFVTSNVLSFLLASLSLKDDRLRAIAYTALATFEKAIRKQRKPSQPLLQFFDMVRSSIPEPNTLVAPVMATLLARMPVVLFGQSSSSSIKPLNQYLKEVGTIPLAASNRPTIPRAIATSFYYPSDLDSAKNQRAFLLDVVATCVRDLDSLGSGRDGFSMIPMLVSLLSSPLCSSPAEYLLILKLLSDLAKSSEAAVHKLVRLHRLHLLVPTFMENKFVLETGSRLNVDRNKAAVAEYVTALGQSFSRSGICVPNTFKALSQNC